MEKNHIHSDDCHDNNNNNKYKNRFKTLYIVFFSLLFILLCIFLIKPYIANQISSIGFTYIESGLYKEAIRQYKKAIFLNNKDLKSMYWLAHCYKMQNDLESAMKTYNKMLAIDPENRNTLLNFGLALGLGGKREEAIAYFEKIRYLGPSKEDRSAINMIDSYKQALIILSTYYEKTGNLGKTRDILLEFLKHYPDEKQVASKLKEIETRLSK